MVVQEGRCGSEKRKQAVNGKQEINLEWPNEETSWYTHFQLNHAHISKGNVDEQVLEVIMSKAWLMPLTLQLRTSRICLPHLAISSGEKGLDDACSLYFLFQSLVGSTWIIK